MFFDFALYPEMTKMLAKKKVTKLRSDAQNSTVLMMEDKMWNICFAQGNLLRLMLGIACANATT